MITLHSNVFRSKGNGDIFRHDFVAIAGRKFKLVFESNKSSGVVCRAYLVCDSGLEQVLNKFDVFSTYPDSYSWCTEDKAADAIERMVEVLKKVYS